MDDNQLMARLAQGDPAALATLMMMIPSISAAQMIL